MKKIIFSLLMLVISVSHAFADGLSAMLQQGDSIQLFYGITALTQACNAADTIGAVITLSPGNFGSLTIEKKNLKVIGNYGLTHTLEMSYLANLTIAADNVIIDGLYVNETITLGNIHDCQVLRSRMNIITGSGTHVNTVVDQCNVVGEVRAQDTGHNFTIKNSTINKFNGVGLEDYPSYVLNCVVYGFSYEHHSSYDGIVGCYWDTNAPIAIYKNNIIKIRPRYNGDYIFFSSPREYLQNMIVFGNSSYTFRFHSGCFNEENTVIMTDSILTADQYPSYPINPGLGMDGTVRGPQGGTGFVEYPNIPRITGRTIDSQVDEEGKLNVKISVKAK